MRRNERIYEDDDGRTVADMSDIEPQPMLIPIGLTFLVAGALAIIAMQTMWS